ncbi:MAG: hypothetical protein K6F94_08060 [Bacteroidaceae bacterium]|nr:hypothetical protein [Bacteroidaceae bacterium]
MAKEDNKTRINCVFMEKMNKKDKIKGDFEMRYKKCSNFATQSSIYELTTYFLFYTLFYGEDSRTH